MPGFETLGGILNITQILGAIFKHVQDHRSIKDVLEKALERATRICKNIKLLAPLERLKGVESHFVSDTIQDFEDIHNELLAIQEKLMKRNAARTFLTSPETLAQLKIIERRLGNKDHNIQMMGIILTVLVEKRNTKENIDQISNNVVELKSQSIDMEATETLLVQVCQMKYMEISGVLDESQRRKERWIDEIDGTDKFATGISFFEGNKRAVKDFAKAARYLNAALKAGKSEANYYIGMLFRKGKGVKRCNLRAVEHFQLGTFAKDPFATTALGQCYIFGAGVESDIALGLAYAEKGARGGDPVGMSIRGWHKLYGSRTERNPTLAFQLSQKSVDLGNKNAKMNLAKCYMHGIGVERNAKAAVKLWTECIEGGGSLCIEELAQYYEEGIGIDVDMVKAADLYRRGLRVTTNTWTRASVQPYYGLCLIRGSGTVKDVNKGWTQIKSSVQTNHGNGWFVQGQCYRFGYGVERNIRKAIDYYELATKSDRGLYGRIRAHFALGSMYESGEAVMRNDSKAFEHFYYGANQMYRDAQWKVAVLCESGVGVEQNIDRAVEYFRLAANSGHRSAQLKAYTYYMKGKGVGRNLMRDTDYTSRS